LEKKCNVSLEVIQYYHFEKKFAIFNKINNRLGLNKTPVTDKLLNSMMDDLLSPESFIDLDGF